MTSELIVIVLALVIIPGHLTTCPQSWYYMADYPSICYSDISKTAYTWTSAQTYCASLSQTASLPYFNTVSEYQSYRRYAIYKNLSSSCAYHWLGIDGSGKWINNQTSTFTYFDPSQVASCGSNYVVQHYSTGYEWTKICNLKTTSLFLCQLRVGNDPPQGLVTYAQCQNGWLADSFGNCYYYVNVPDKWTNAMANCKSMQANLPQFCYTNGDYFDFVQQQMFFEPFGCIQDTWLGSKTGSTCTFDSFTKFFNTYPSTADCSVKKTYYCQIHANYNCATTTILTTTTSSSILTSRTTSTSMTSSTTIKFTTTDALSSSASASVTSNSQIINKTTMTSTISTIKSATQSSSSATNSNFVSTSGIASSTTSSTLVSHSPLTSYSETTISAYISSSANALTTSNLTTRSTISTNKNQVNTSTLTSTTLATTNLSTSGGPLAANLTANSSVSISSLITSIYSTAKNLSGTTGGQTQYTTIASTTLNRVTSISTGNAESPSSTTAFYTSKTDNISSVSPSTLSQKATYNFSVPSSSYSNTNTVSQRFSQTSATGLVSFNNRSGTTSSIISAISLSSSTTADNIMSTTSTILTLPSSITVTYGAGSTWSSDRNISISTTLSMKSSTPLYSTKGWNISLNQFSSNGSTIDNVISTMSSVLNNSSAVSLTFSQLSSTGLTNSNITSEAMNSFTSTMISLSSSVVQSSTSAVFTSERIMVASTANATSFTSNFKATDASEKPITNSNTSNRATSSTYTMLLINFSTNIIEVTNSTKRRQNYLSTSDGSIMLTTSTIFLLQPSMSETSGTETTLYPNLGMTATFSVLYSSNRWNTSLNQSSSGSLTTGNVISTTSSNLDSSELLSTSTVSLTVIFVTSQTQTYSKIGNVASTIVHNVSTPSQNSTQMQYTFITGIETATSMYLSTSELGLSTVNQTYHETGLKTTLLESSTITVVSDITSTVFPSLSELTSSSQVKRTTTLGMANVSQAIALWTSSNQQWGDISSGNEFSQQVTSTTRSSEESLGQSFITDVSPPPKIQSTTSSDVTVTSEAQLPKISSQEPMELVTQMRTNPISSLTAGPLAFFGAQPFMREHAQHITFAFAADESVNEQFTSRQGPMFQQSDVLTTSTSATSGVIFDRPYPSSHDHFTDPAFFTANQNATPAQTLPVIGTSKSESISGKKTYNATSTIPGNIKTTGINSIIRQSETLMNKSSKNASFTNIMTEQIISTLNISDKSIAQSPVPSTTTIRAVSYSNLLDLLSGRSVLTSNIAVSTKPPFFNVKAFMKSLYPALDALETSAKSSSSTSNSIKMSITDLQGNLTSSTIPAIESVKSKFAGSTASTTNPLNTELLGNNVVPLFINTGLIRSTSATATSLRVSVMSESVDVEPKMEDNVVKVLVNSTFNVLTSTKASVRLLSTPNISIEEAAPRIFMDHAYTSYARGKPTALALPKTDSTTPDDSQADYSTTGISINTSRSSIVAYSNFSTTVHTTVVIEVTDQQEQGSLISTKRLTFGSISPIIPVTRVSNLTKPAISGLKTDKILDRNVLDNLPSGFSYSMSVSKGSRQKTSSFPTPAGESVSLNPNPTNRAVMNYTVNNPVPTSSGHFAVDKSVEEQMPSSADSVADASAKNTFIPVQSNLLSLSSTPQKGSNEISNQLRTTISGHNPALFPTSQKSFKISTILYMKSNNQRTTDKESKITLSPGISANDSMSDLGESQNLLTIPPFQARRMFPSTAVEEKSLLDDENGFAKLSKAEKLGMLGIDQDALKDPMALTSSMQDSLSFIMQSLNDSFLSEIGEQRKSLIFDCLFDRHSCNNDKDIIRIRNSVYGNCFSFNNNNATLPKYTISAGMENGLKMIMHIDQTDYNCNVEQAGIRMIIHDQDVQPTPEMDGYYIETGVVTYFNIIQSHQVVLKPRCFDLDDKTFDYVYSVENCQLMCYQDYMISKCNCTDPRYMSVESRGYAKCGIDRKTCLDYHLNCNNTLEQVECDCRPKCSDMSYTSTMTKTQMKSNADADHECRLNSNASICHQDLNYALIYVYYGSMSSIVYSEDHAYGFVQLLSDFSGVGGLYTGVSSFTIFECIPFLYWSLKHLFKIAVAKLKRT